MINPEKDISVYNYIFNYILYDILILPPKYLAFPYLGQSRWEDKVTATMVRGASTLTKTLLRWSFIYILINLYTYWRGLCKIWHSLNTCSICKMQLSFALSLASNICRDINEQVSWTGLLFHDIHILLSIIKIWLYHRSINIKFHSMTVFSVIKG